MTAVALLRRAVTDDVGALAELHVKTFRESHGGGPSVELRRAQWTEALQQADQFCFVLEEPATRRLVGFAKGTLHDRVDGLPFDGELDKIYLLKEFQSRGLGRTMICAVASEFMKRGIQSMLLFGDAKNPSNGFYESLGAERLYSPEGDFHGGYGWRNLRELADRCGPQDGTTD